MTDQHAPIVWLDTETTGLSPEFDQLLEVACVVTGADLEPVGAFNCVVHHDELVSMREVVWDMHNNSGLLDEVRYAGKPLIEVELSLYDFIKKNGVTGDSPLAGCTIHFDRNFLKRDLPLVDAAIHYRNIDVSSLRELIKRWAPEQLYKKGDRHRALPDVLDSISQLRHYRELFGV